MTDSELVSNTTSDAAGTVHSYVYCFLIDMIRSTSQRDRRSSVATDRFDDALDKYLDPLLEPLGLSAVHQHSTGDGFQLLTENENDLQALCCLGVIMSRRFRSQLAKMAAVPVDNVPSLRISICGGKGTKKRSGYVGTSGIRATRANKYCLPNEVLVDEAVRVYVCDDFDLELVDFGRRPPDLKPEHVEDDYRLYSLKDLRLENLLEWDLLPIYRFTLSETGREAKAHELLMELEKRLNKETQRLSDRPSETQLHVAKRWSILLNSQPDYEQARRVFERMVSEGIEPNVYVYSMLMNKSATFGEARAWLSEMERRGVEPNVVSYSTLLAKAPDYGAAVDCFSEMCDAGVRPNDKTYGCLLAKSPDYETAKAWMDQMSLNGVEPTSYMYAGMVIKSPDYATAMQWLDAMEKRGIVMPSPAYSMMMNKSTDYETALAWYESMRRRRIRPDVFTLNMLLEKAPDYPTAEAWVTELTGRHVVPDIVTFNTMIKRSPDNRNACDWYEKARALGLQPTLHTLIALVYHSLGLDEALDWMDRLVAEGITVDTRVVQPLLHLASTDESIERVRRKAKSVGFHLDVACFNVILRKTPNLDEAHKVVDDMRRSGIRPDENTYQILLRLTTDCESGVWILDSMERDGVVLTPEIGGLIIRNATNYRQGLDLLNRLRRRGMAITATVWDSLFRLDLTGVSAQELLETFVKEPMRPRQAMQSAISKYRIQERWDDCLFLVMNYPFLAISLAIMRKRFEPSCAYFRTFLDDPKQGHNAAYALGLALHAAGQDKEAIEYLRVARDGAGLGARQESLDKLIDSISPEGTTGGNDL